MRDSHFLGTFLDESSLPSRCRSYIPCNCMCVGIYFGWYFSFSFIWVRYANPVQKITFPNFNGSELSAKSVDGMMARWKVRSLPFFCSLYVYIYIYVYVGWPYVLICLFVWWKAKPHYFKIGFSNWIWFWDPEIHFESPKVGFQASRCNVFQLDSWWGRDEVKPVTKWGVLRVRWLDYRGNGNCHISSIFWK